MTYVVPFLYLKQQRMKIFQSLTGDFEILGGFHCWIVNKGTFVFTRSVTWNICHGVSVVILHFHHFSLERNATKQWHVINLEWIVNKSSVAADIIPWIQSCVEVHEVYVEWMCTLRWKLKLVGAGFPSATHFRVTLSPSVRGSWGLTWRTMFSVESVHKIWTKSNWKCIYSELSGRQLTVQANAI